jgi:phosphocarrier protein
MPAAAHVRRAKLVVTSQIGMHARPAAMLITLAQRFDADIEVSLNGLTVSAKSILGLLTLCAGHGAEVKVAADGPDAEEAISAITGLSRVGFTNRGARPHNRRRRATATPSWWLTMTQAAVT